MSRTFKSEFKHSEADRGLWYPVHDPLNAGEREAFPLREKSPSGAASWSLSLPPGGHGERLRFHKQTAGAWQCDHELG